MRHPKRIFEIIHTEKIRTDSGYSNLRICAITDQERFRLARLNNQMPVRIEIQQKGNSYEVVQMCLNIAEAEKEFKKWTEWFKQFVQAPGNVDISDYDVEDGNEDDFLYYLSEDSDNDNDDYDDILDIADIDDMVIDNTKTLHRNACCDGCAYNEDELSRRCLKCNIINTEANLNLYIKIA